jgi:hypothetical protein
MTFRKIWDLILKTWKDPVWSKVIATTIIFLIATAWTKYSDYTLNDITSFLVTVLTTPFPLYLTLSIISIYYIIRLAIKFFKSRTHPIWDEQVGNYKFKELYAVLQRQNYSVQTIGMQYSGQSAPEENLLAVFMTYAAVINMGVTLDRPHDDGGYLYGVLCPKLISYGLVTKTVIEEEGLGTVERMRFDMSDVGHKFHSLMEKVIRLQQK